MKASFTGGTLDGKTKEMNDKLVSRTRDEEWVFWLDTEALYLDMDAPPAQVAMKSYHYARPAGSNGPFTLRHESERTVHDRPVKK